MIEAEIRIINPLGLHARAAAQLVKLAGKFKCKISLVRLDNAVFADAKSILSVLTLAAAKGTILTIAADGIDEADGLKAIVELVEKGFGEL